MDPGFRDFILRKVNSPGYVRRMVEDDRACERLLKAVFRQDLASNSNRSKECSNSKYTGLTLLKLEYRIEQKRKEVRDGKEEG